MHTCFIRHKDDPEGITTMIALPAIPTPGGRISFRDEEEFARRYEENNFIVCDVTFMANEPAILIDLIPEAIYEQLYAEAQKQKKS